MDTLLDILRDNRVPYSQPRREARLIEDPDEAYGWFIEHRYIDLEIPDLSCDTLIYLPGPCSNRRARWAAWELGFAV